MSLKVTRSVLTGAALASALGLALTGCGREGPLDQPPPLFGDGAKGDYAAKQAARAAQSNTATPPPAAADQPDRDSDNAPPTARDLKAPSQQDVPISKEPILGVPDPNPPTPSMSPPGG